MDTTVSITNSRETELQFDISVEGVDVTTMEARFVIEADGVQYSFDCKQGDEAAKWVVKIPPMPHLKHGEYDFHIEIITNGYYFNPYHGTVKVTPEPTVSKSEVKNDKPPAPVVKISSAPEVAKEEEESSAPVISEEDDDPKSDDLLDAFMKHRKDKPRVEESAADKAIKAALNDFKKKPLKESAPKKKAAPVKLPKKKVVETKEPRRSNLDSVIKNMDTPKDDQAKKVLDIINSIDKGKE